MMVKRGRVLTGFKPAFAFTKMEARGALWADVAPAAAVAERARLAWMGGAINMSSKSNQHEQFVRANGQLVNQSGPELIGRAVREMDIPLLM